MLVCIHRECASWTVYVKCQQNLVKNSAVARDNCAPCHPLPKFEWPLVKAYLDGMKWSCFKGQRACLRIVQWPGGLLGIDAHVLWRGRQSVDGHLDAFIGGHKGSLSGAFDLEVLEVGRVCTHLQAGSILVETEVALLEGPRLPVVFV